MILKRKRIVSTNQFAVNFVPEKKELETVYFYDLTELELNQQCDLYLVSFRTRSLLDSVEYIQSLIGEFGNFIIDNDVMLYGTFLSINVNYDHKVFTAPFYNEMYLSKPVPSECCTIDFQFSGNIIGSDENKLQSITTTTEYSNYNAYDDISDAYDDISDSSDVYRKKAKTKKEIVKKLKRKITFK